MLASYAKTKCAGQQLQSVEHLFFSVRINFEIPCSLPGWQKVLRDGESNPGLPRDRRGYSPLYYRGDVILLWFLIPEFFSIIIRAKVPRTQNYPSPVPKPPMTDV